MVRFSPPDSLTGPESESRRECIPRIDRSNNKPAYIRVGVANIEFLIAGALGIGPALGLLFHAMRKYDVPHVDVPLFDTRTLFMLFAVGMVFGAASSYLANQIIPPFAPFLQMLLLLIFLALFEELFKLVITNLKRFQLKNETTFYGLSLGLGTSSVTIIFLVGYTLFVFRPEGMALARTLTAIAVYSIAISALHASTGSFIGHGAATRHVWSYFFQAMICRVVFAVLILPFFSGGSENILVSLFSLAAATAFSIFVYAHSYYRILPETLPDKVKKRRRRQIRKMRIGSKD